MFASEFLKLKGSYVGVVCLLIPLLASGLGTLNYAHNLDQLEADWSSLTSQASLFYALFFFNLGGAVVLSSVWKDDIRENNWNSLLTCYSQKWKIFVSKVTVGLVLLIVMHIIFIILTALFALSLNIKSIDIGDFLISGLIVIFSAIPLVIIQSMFSFMTRNYALPIGICLALCVTSVAVVTNESMSGLKFVSPQALSTFAIAAPSPSFHIGGSLSSNFITCAIATIVQIAIYSGITILVFKHRLRKA